MEEVTKNYDGGVSSSYFYKDSDAVDGRIKAAPIWDCDMSMGSGQKCMRFFTDDPRGVSKLVVNSDPSFWYKTLYEKEEVYDKICTYYAKNMAPYLELLVNEKIDEYKKYLEDSAAMNHIRWKVDLDNNEFYTDRDSSFETLKQYMKQRKEFLDEVWK